MERRRKGARESSPGCIAASLSLPPDVKASSSVWAHIRALIDTGRQVMIGTIADPRSRGRTHDGKSTLAMLRRRPGEAVPELLARLAATIATAKSTGPRVDEINDPSSDRRYEI